MVHIAESTVGRRYAGWFIRNTEHAQRVLDTLRNAPLPIAPKVAASSQPADAAAKGAEATPAAPPARTGGKKVAWGSAQAA